MTRYLVVGSGPTGISCAQALLNGGAAVLMIDGGEKLEPERRQKLEVLAQIDPSLWNGANTSFLKDGITAGASGIPLKRAYGSDYPYRLSAGATPSALIDADIKASYALGGLSTVWGSAVMPYRQEDLDEWPVGVRDLEDGYRRVLEFMPLAGRQDDLAKIFPLYTQHTTPLPLSRQALQLLQHLQSKRDHLRRRGVYFGTSRLAVDAKSCVLCRNCMYGCPRQLIYASDATLGELRRHPSFEHRAGLTVRELAESNGTVTVRALDRSGAPIHLEAPRVFLAAGVLETASILLRSRKQYDQPVVLRDSQYFLLPALRRRGVPNVYGENLHTLAQLFLEIFDNSISPYSVHLQTYTYNELFRDAVLSTLGPLKAIFPAQQFLSRLLLFQGYLHSNHSSTLNLTLRKEGDSDRLQVEGKHRPETAQRLRTLVRKLIRLYPLTDLFPLFPMMQQGAAGRGFHCGGTFPMSADPGPGETDIYGRPYGMQRIHVVDASTFPTVPATTITYTAMANAYRVASHLPAYERAA